MSVIKPFLLLFLLHHKSVETVFDWVGMQPSDMPFNSLNQLLIDRGFPRNPMINSGAIALADKLPGTTASERCRQLCDWLNQQANCQLSLDQSVLTAVQQSNRDANLALVESMSIAKVLQNPDLALDTYEQICCLAGRVADLAKLGNLLALDNQLAPQHRRIVNAIMLTCGLYEVSGLYATRIGLPIKSGVSGALLAVVPQQGAIACYSPALDVVGNPVAGLAFVEQMAQELELSVFG
jgi:glutaminase